MKMRCVVLLVLFGLVLPTAALARADHFPPLAQVLEELPNVAHVLKDAPPLEGKEIKSGSLKIGSAAMVFSFQGKNMELMDSATFIVITGSNTTNEDHEAAFMLCEMVIRKLFVNHDPDQVVDWIADSLIRQLEVMQVGGRPKGDKHAFYGGRLVVTATRTIVGGNMMTHLNLSLPNGKSK